MADQPMLNICRYKVKPGKEAEFEALLARHWHTLHAAGLLTDEPATVYRGIASGKPGERHGAKGWYVEIFSWKSKEGPGLAHQTPEVMSVWEPMGAICEELDFPFYEPLQLPEP